MRITSLLVLLSVVVLLAACNRRAGSVAGGDPVITGPATSSATEEQASETMIDFPDDVRDRESGQREAGLTAQGAAMQKAMEAQRKRIAETGIQEVVAELRTTGCYGECPTYTIRIMTDNSLRYHGRKGVDMLGTFTGTVDFNAMSKLILLMTRERFFAMSATYPEDLRQAPVDLSATITKIDYQGRSNRVMHYVDGPEGLVAIENYLKGLVEKATWTPLKIAE